jgi:hypothetical protein
VGDGGWGCGTRPLPACGPREARSRSSCTRPAPSLVARRAGSRPPRNGGGGERRHGHRRSGRDRTDDVSGTERVQPNGPDGCRFISGSNCGFVVMPHPKSGSRQGEQRESIRAWNGHREDAVFVDSGVSLDPAPERVLIPSRESERVRCPLLDRLFFKCPRRDLGLKYTPRRGPNRRGDPVVGTGTKTSVSLDVVLFGTCGMHHARPRLVRG